MFKSNMVEEIIFYLSLPALFLCVLSIFVGIPKAPWVNTRKKERNVLLNNMHIPKGSVVYDLGCGDASFLIELIHKFPDCKYIGVEIFFPAYLLSKIRSWKYPNLNIYFKNLYTQNLHDADIIYAFLLPRMYEKLQLKFRHEILDDTEIYMLGWPFKEKKPLYILKESDTLPIYLYKGKQFK